MSHRLRKLEEVKFLGQVSFYRQIAVIFVTIFTKFGYMMHLVTLMHTKSLDVESEPDSGER